jgi:hypothetical protein
MTRGGAGLWRGEKDFVTGNCAVHRMGQWLAGDVYAVVEPDRPGVFR